MSQRSKRLDTEQMKTAVAMAKTTVSIAQKLDRYWLNPEHAKTWDDNPLGARQYRIFAIPNPSTKLNLGEWVSNPFLVGLGLPFGFPGISMDTAANFYARTGGNAVFQVAGPTTFQSASEWTQFAKALDVTVKEKTTLASGKSVTIAAGPTGDYEAPPPAGPDLRPPSFDKGRRLFAFGGPRVGEG